MRLGKVGLESGSLDRACTGRQGGRSAASALIILRTPPPLPLLRRVRNTNKLERLAGWGAQTARPGSHWLQRSPSQQLGKNRPKSRLHAMSHSELRRASQGTNVKMLLDPALRSFPCPALPPVQLDPIGSPGNSPFLYLLGCESDGTNPLAQSRSQCDFLEILALVIHELENIRLGTLETAHGVAMGIDTDFVQLTEDVALGFGKGPGSRKDHFGQLWLSCRRVQDAQFDIGPVRNPFGLEGALITFGDVPQPANKAAMPLEPGAGQPVRIIVERLPEA